MKERPIIFSAPMVRAILEGRKTQTRRIIKPQPPGDHPFPQELLDGEWEWTDRDVDSDDLSHWPSYEKPLLCPYGQPGGRLWVRETFSPFNAAGSRAPISQAEFVVFADGAVLYRDGHYKPGLSQYAPGAFDAIRWRPSIHMPRWASRIILELTEVRVQRLKDISEEGAKAEGVEAKRRVSWSGLDPRGDYGHVTTFGECAPDWMVHPRIRVEERSAKEQFRSLWDSINSERAPWDSNPWAWALTFRRLA